MGFQLPLFGTAPRERRVCFFSLHKRMAQRFSAYAPKAMLFFAEKYSIPVIDDVAQLDSFDVVLFSHQRAPRSLRWCRRSTPWA